MRRFEFDSHKLNSAKFELLHFSRYETFLSSISTRKCNFDFKGMQIDIPTGNLDTWYKNKSVYSHVWRYSFGHRRNLYTCQTGQADHTYVPGAGREPPSSHPEIRTEQTEMTWNRFRKDARLAFSDLFCWWDDRQGIRLSMRVETQKRWFMEQLDQKNI